MKKIFVHLLNLLRFISFYFEFFFFWRKCFILGILVGVCIRFIRSYWLYEYFCKNLFCTYTSSNPRLKPARSLSLKRGVCDLLIWIWQKKKYYFFCLFSLMVHDIMVCRILVHLLLHQHLLVVNLLLYNNNSRHHQNDNQKFLYEDLNRQINSRYVLNRIKINLLVCNLD